MRNMNLKWFFGIRPRDPKKWFGIFILFIFLILVLKIIFKGNYVVGFIIIGAFIIGFIINFSIVKTKNPRRNMNIFGVIFGTLLTAGGIVLMIIESFIAGLNPFVPGIIILTYSLSNLIKKQPR